jgi:type IV pilus assembly protein PilM
MLNSKSFLAVDFGATNLKVAEFEVNESGGLLLKQYGFRSLGVDGTQEATREGAIQKALTELLSEKGFKARHVNICAPGFHTFSKFVKLPPVDTAKVTQIIQYEAQQNVPFPLEEVVWDYQILGATPTGELEVLLVAIKSDIVEGLFRAADNAGARLNLVDVSPAALSNAFRFNYGDLEGCTMLLDIGAKTSNLLFFEKGNIYSRGINIGANSITQDFAKESKLSYEQAERLKVEEGFVSLGGAYEEPENAHQAAISKIARQVLTRLHIQVNQTIQFYRGQQGGSPPERLFLSGGATSMAYTAQFFSEKLNLPVEYFNPLRNVQLEEGLNREELAKVAHSMGEVVGLGLRNLARCPVDLNLMPRSSKKRQEFSRKKPYLAAAALCLILILFAVAMFFRQIADEREAAFDKLKQIIGPAEQAKSQMEDASRQLKISQTQCDQNSVWLGDKCYWGSILVALRETMIAVEDRKEKEHGTKNIGVWVERLAPIIPAGYLSVSLPPPQGICGNTNVAGGEPAPPPPGPGQGPPGSDGRGRGFRGRGPGGGGGERPIRQAPSSGGPEIDCVLLTCRGVNLKSIGDAANTGLANAVEEELKSRTNYFDADSTKLVGEAIGFDSTNLTISFTVQVKLARPMKL